MLTTKLQPTPTQLTNTKSLIQILLDNEFETYLNSLRYTDELMNVAIHQLKTTKLNYIFIRIDRDKLDNLPLNQIINFLITETKRINDRLLVENYNNTKFENKPEEEKKHENIINNKMIIINNFLNRYL